MSRFEELRLELSNQPDIEISGENTTFYRDERKGISYKETSVTVTPKGDVVHELATFTEGLLPNFVPLYRNNTARTLTSFEGTKETGFEVFRIQVSHRKEVAE